MKKKILYVHGLGSSANSSTGEMLRELLSEYEIITFDVPFDPLEADKLITELGKNVDMIIGSSLGGFYAQSADKTPKILINPALNPSTLFRESIGLGTYDYHSERQDGIQTYTIDNDYLEKLKMLEEVYVLWADTDAVVIWGTEDNLITDSTREMCEKLYYDSIRYEMGHRCTRECIENVIAPLVRKALDDEKPQ